MCLSLCGSLSRAQTRIDARTQTKNIDYSGAVLTKPVKTVVELPASCSVGELVIKLNDAAGKHLYICAAANTWASWSTQSGLPPLTGEADKLLSNDGAAAAWRAIGGDVSGRPEAMTVTGLRGRPVGTAAPAQSDILAWDAGLSQWTPKRYWFSEMLGLVSNAQLPSSPTFVSITTGDGVKAGELTLYEAPANGNDSVSLVAPESLAAVLRYVLPATAPVANQVLQAEAAPDANGTVATRWATAVGGGGLSDPGANGVVKRTAAGTTAIATGADLPAMGASGTAHSAGAVPDPGATAGTTRFLREDGSWAVAGGSSGLSDPGASGVVKRTVAGQTAIATGADLPVMAASGAAHSTGAVPDPGATAGTTRYLREDASWTAALSDPGANGVVKRTAAGATATAAGSDLPVMGASGAAHSAGAVPDPGAAAGTARYLREDASWTAALSDPGANGVVKRTAAGVTTTAAGSDLPVMGASGVAHSAGAVPDPGATEGSTRFLREDGTWAAPAGGSAPSMFSTAGVGYYFPFGNSWYSISGQGVAFASNVNIYQLSVPVGMTVGQITFRVHSAPASCSLQCGLVFALYNSAGSLLAQTTPIVSGGAPDLLSTGIATASFVTAQALTAGTYYLAWVSDNTSVQIGVVNASNYVSSLWMNKNAARCGRCTNVATGTGSGIAMPTTCGAVTTSSYNPPAVMFER